MFKNIVHFTIIFLLSLTFNGQVHAKYIVEEKIPLVFKGTLRSIDSSSTALFHITENFNYLNLMRKVGLRSKHFGFTNESRTDFILRVGIAGAPNTYLTKEDKKKIIEGITETEYELTCYTVELFQDRGRLPICYIVIEGSDTPLIETLHKTFPKYLPLDYESVKNVPELVDLVGKIEKKLIISDFLL